MFFKRLPVEIQALIWAFDPTYREIFSGKVVQEMNVMMAKRLASQYYDGPSQDFTKTSFRFFQNGQWFTAHFQEIDYNQMFLVSLWYEKQGIRATHFHPIR